MVDMVAQPPIGDMAEFARQICSHEVVGKADGVLYVVKEGEHYAMRMFNPDGSEAEMCGNGIRCVARLVEERFFAERDFTLLSGGNSYPIHRADDIAGCIRAYGVDIGVKTTSPDFGFAEGRESFIGQEIASLGGEEQFTALNLGNPHIVAEVEHVDMELLEALGERVKTLKQEFPDGINVSLYECRSERELFVATYERGAGITMSCGTAMTASATAAALLRRTTMGERIDVKNCGGKVFCTTSIIDGKPVTKLAGNATFVWWGSASFEKGALSYSIERMGDEQQRWSEFVASLNR